MEDASMNVIRRHFAAEISGFIRSEVADGEDNAISSNLINLYMRDNIGYIDQQMRRMYVDYHEPEGEENRGNLLRLMNDTAENDWYREYIDFDHIDNFIQQNT